MKDTELTLKDSQTVEVSDKGREFLVGFMKDLDAKEQSKITYGTGIKQYFSWLFNRDRKGDQRIDIIDFKNDMLNGYVLNEGTPEEKVYPKHSATTVSSYLSAVRLFYRYMEAEGIMPNVAASVHTVKKPTGHRKDRVSVEDMKLILRTMKRETVEQKRNFAIVNLLCRVGLRTVEIVRANVEDIDTQTSQEYVNGKLVEHKIRVLHVQGKGRTDKDQIVCLTDTAYQPILEYLESRGAVKETDPLFVSHSNRNHGQRLDTRTIRSIGKGAMVDAGIINPLNTHRLTTHSYRHGVVSMAVKTSGIEEARNLARHSSVSTTMIYWHEDERVNPNAPEFKIDELLDDH